MTSIYLYISKYDLDVVVLATSGIVFFSRDKEFRFRFVEIIFVEM